ncbi:AAA family ATPase [Ramlibacter pallidus]|uniref:ATP-binding protein n=1 Tax=Ramlibacter pallidus TaxID=2780087 RepID=A0ABR9S251_9BURK|nr:ATP-binding protein [Ramlibacter pallidus]MBE7367127.1 ATP-binding protein [Ramlibacter pallidus]
MAHITEFRVDGLLGRTEPIHFNLERDVNVFFGENGSGKTTLLRILDAAMNIDAAAIAKLPVARAEVHIFSLSEDQTVKYVWDRKKKAGVPEDEQLALIDPLSLGATDRMRWAKLRQAETPAWRRFPERKPDSKPLTRWAHSFLPTTRLYVGDSSQALANNRLSDDQLDAVFTESLNRAWLLFNTRTVREVNAIQEDGLRAVLYSALSSKRDKVADPDVDPDDVYVRVRRFLERQAAAGSRMLGSREKFRERYKTDEELRRVVTNLDRVERSVEAAFAPTERFLATIQGLFSRGKTVSAHGNELSVILEDGNRLSVASLSSGEKHLLKLLLTAMNASENSVIIDEPELSMHIDWQREFVGTVHALNPSCQLIMATHSPEIMAELDDKKIFRI